MALLLALPAQAGVKATTHYNIDYGQWEGVANALEPYLDAAFTTPQGVLGYANQGHGKIDVIFYSDPRSSTLGWMQAGENALRLNLYAGSSTSAGDLGRYGSVVAHETAHIFYYHKTRLHQRYDLTDPAMRSDVWVGEAIAFYVGDVAYPRGPRESRASLGASLAYYSSNGAHKASWYDSGVRYAYGGASNLDLMQMEAVGLFLGNHGGNGALARLTDYLARSGDYEAAIQSVYGRPSGQFGTASGPGVDTLYAEYIRYYLGD